MTQVLIAVIAIAAIVLSVISARRALAERNIVERQQQALDLLGKMADRAVTDTTVVTAPGKYRPQHGKAPSPGGRIRTAVIAAAAGACAIVLVVLIVESERGGRSHETLPAGPTTTATLPRPTTTVAPTTTTTAPPALVLISDDTQQASYRIQGPAVEVDVVSSAPCWVEITGAATGGPVKFAGVLRPGSTETVASGPASGASLQVANPALVSLEVNGATMPLPQLSGGQPYTLHFEPLA